MDEIDNIFHLFEMETRQLLVWARGHAERAGPRQVRGFLLTLDMACRHGASSRRHGFWPFAEQFAHSEALRRIAALDAATSGIGKGRAWLLLALQEDTLEFYFTTFLAHAAERARHFRPTAFMRQESHLKRLVVLLAELSATKLSVRLHPEEYDLERHICPLPEAPARAQSPDRLDGASVFVADPSEEPLQWTHTGRRARRPRRSVRTPSSASASACSRQSSGSNSPTIVSNHATPVSNSVTTVPHSATTVSNSATTVSHSPTTVPHSATTVSNSPTTVSHSPDCRSRAEAGVAGRAASSDTRSASPAVNSAATEPSAGDDAMSSVASGEGSRAVTVSSLGEDGFSAESTHRSADVLLKDRMSSSSSAPSPEPATTVGTPAGDGDTTNGNGSSWVGSSASVMGELNTSGVVQCDKGAIAVENADESAPRTPGNGADVIAYNSDACCKSVMKEPISPIIGDQNVPSTVQTTLSNSSILEAVRSPGSSAVHSSPVTASNDNSSVLPTFIDASQTSADSGVKSAIFGQNITCEVCSDDTGAESNAKVNEQSVLVPEEKSLVNDEQLASTVTATPVKDPDDSGLVPNATSTPNPDKAPPGDAASAPSAASQRRPSSTIQGDGTPVRRPAAVHLSSTSSSSTVSTRRRAPLPAAQSDVTLRRRTSAACLPDKRVTWAGTDRETAAVAALLPAPPARGERGAPEGQEDPPRAASRAPSTLSISSSSGRSTVGSGGGGRGAAGAQKRRTRLYEPAALGSPLPPQRSRDETERHIEAELREAQQKRQAAAPAHSALVQIDHSLATRLVVSFFRDDELARDTGFKVLWGDHLSLRPCLLVLTTYRLILLRRSTMRRLRAGAEPPADHQPPDASYPYFDINSVKVAFHEQAVALQCRDGAYSRWLWLGDRAETRRLVTHLQAAVGASPLRPPPPHVHTSQPQRHLYTAEIGRRESKPDLLFTLLAYFEDFEVPGETAKLSAQLMYKTSLEQTGWSVAHFVLWDTDLLLYPSEAAARAGGPPLDRWPLTAVSSVRRLTALQRPHQLQLLTPQRQLVVAAPDADTAAHLRATVVDVMELTVPDRLPSPAPRCVVLTRRALYVVQEMEFSPRLTPGYELCPQGQLVVASGSLRTLAVANADAHAAVHLEFDAADAAETTGSWRLYFLSVSEQRDFLRQLLDAYSARRKVALSIGPISHHMREVCRSGSRYVRNRWDGIVDR